MLARRPLSECKAVLTWLVLTLLPRGREQKRSCQCKRSTELPWHYFTRLCLQFAPPARSESQAAEAEIATWARSRIAARQVQYRPRRPQTAQKSVLSRIPLRLEVVRALASAPLGIAEARAAGVRPGQQQKQGSRPAAPKHHGAPAAHARNFGKAPPAPGQRPPRANLSVQSTTPAFINGRRAGFTIVFDKEGTGRAVVGPAVAFADLHRPPRA